MKQNIKIGDQFGRLTVIDLIQTNSNGRCSALCRCDCGNEIMVIPSRLRNKSVKSCGCLAKEKNRGKYAKDLVGRRFDRLLVIRYSRSFGGRKMWFCKCDCGNEVEVDSSSLLNKHTRSCGCLHQEIVKKQETTHGMCRTKFYRAYTNMKQRCENTKNSEYHNYGARGIKCLWKSFEDFMNDMYEEYKKHLEIHGEKNTTIERVDVNGNYCKDNCVWATIDTQSNNKRVCHYVDFNGERLTVKQVSKLVDIPYQTMIDRLNHGKDIYGNVVVN